MLCVSTASFVFAVRVVISEMLRCPFHGGLLISCVEFQQRLRFYSIERAKPSIAAARTNGVRRGFPQARDFARTSNASLAPSWPSLSATQPIPFVFFLLQPPYQNRGRAHVARRRDARAAALRTAPTRP